jgi:hypothetical protein
MSKFNKVFFVFIACLIIFAIGFKLTYTYESFKSGQNVYQIKVNTFDRHESYMTNFFVIDSTSGCIKFKDEFGIKRIVCNNYTITEF